MRFHDSQAYRKMDGTRERISRILELREILLSIQTGFSLVNYAAVVCAILETPEGRPEMSDVSPLSGISGLSFDSTLLSPLFFCLVLLPFLSYRFLPAGPFF